MEFLTDRLPAFVETFLAHFDDKFKNDIERRRARQYVVGLLMSGSNKTMTEMARHIVGANNQSMHHFLTQAPWDPDELNRRRMEGWLIVARNVLTDEVKYLLSNAPERTRRETMLHVAFTRWHVEKLFKESKGEIGLGHFEVRRYLPVIRHLILSMASLLFLVERTERLRGGGAGGGASAR